jgi:hypothetical protein
MKVVLPTSTNDATALRARLGLGHDGGQGLGG